MIEITLPWPPKELSPNARVHWAKKAKIAKQYKQACFAETRQSSAVIDFEGDIHAFIDFYPPDKRRRDDDNMIASFKHGRDGVAAALGVDDVRFRVHPFVMRETGGVIRVRLTKKPVGTEEGWRDDKNGDKAVARNNRSAS